MRRKDREVIVESEKLSILDACEVMRLGLCADDTPYVVPMHFAYELKNATLFLYFHCASQGRKMDIINKNNRVCFETDRLIRTVKREKACDWSAEFESVIGEGRVEVLGEASDKVHALNLIMRRYGFEGVPEFTDSNLSAVTVLRVVAESFTAKRAINNT